jgi:probable HAF family extracellular repeat protein
MKTQARRPRQFVMTPARWLLVTVLAGTVPPAQVGALRAARQDKGGVPAEASDHYRFVTIDLPGGTGYGINDTGLLSGYYLDASGNYHGFLWRNGKVTTVDHSGAADTELGASSNRGVIVGNYGDATIEHAAIYNLHRAVWIPLPNIPNQPLNFGDGINNAGTATGSNCVGNQSVGPVFNCVGWTWNGSEYSFFTVPGADEALLGTLSNGINDRGQVVGYFPDASGVLHGFLRAPDGTFNTIDVPAAGTESAQGSLLFDINNRGELAGYYYDASSTPHGFTESKETFTTVDVPGATATLIFGNNQRGDLAGAWYDSTGTEYPFVAFRR